MHLDLYGDPDRRDPISAFVQLLWERGNAFEEEKIWKEKGTDKSLLKIAHIIAETALKKLAPAAFSAPGAA